MIPEWTIFLHHYGRFMGCVVFSFLPKKRLYLPKKRLNLPKKRRILYLLKQNIHTFKGHKCLFICIFATKYAGCKSING